MSAEPAVAPALQCTGLAVSYAGTPALEGIDLSVPGGEVVALLGRSGSGKSTLLHAVAGLVQPAAGEIRLAGRRVATAARAEPPERREVGLVFQEFALWPHLAVLDTVAYPLRRAGHSRREAHAAARGLLDQLEIGRLAERRPAELSGGEQQRVGLARALAREPRLFLLDEPTAHLDTHLRAAFQDCVRERQRATGAAAIYATHDAAEALALADRVGVLVGGRLVQLDRPETVYAQPVSAAVAALTGACSVLSGDVAAIAGARIAVDLGDGAAGVPGAGTRATRPHRRELVLRPDWVHLDGPFRGRITARAFRGPHTDYQLATAGGAVQLQLPGPPARAVGEEVTWGMRRVWVLPPGEPPVETAAGVPQPRAAIAPG